MAKRKARAKGKKPSFPTLFAFIFIVAVAFALYLSTIRSPSGDRDIAVSADDDPFLGNPNAPVTMIMFTNYACAFSRDFWQNTFPLLKAQYIDTGKVKFVYRDFPFDTPGLIDSSLAAECADEQGAFWQYNDKLINSVYIDKDSLKQYAADLGLNLEQFNSCLDSQKYLEELRKDSSDGVSYGAQGTPTFFINGQKVEGDEGFAFFSNLIKKELRG